MNQYKESKFQEVDFSFKWVKSSNIDEQELRIKFVEPEYLKLPFKLQYKMYNMDSPWMDIKTDKLSVKFPNNINPYSIRFEFTLMNGETFYSCEKIVEELRQRKLLPNSICI